MLVTPGRPISRKREFRTLLMLNVRALYEIHYLAG